MKVKGRKHVFAWMLCSIISALTFLGCSGGSSDYGALSLKMIDATTDEFQAIYVTIDEVLVHKEGAYDEDGEPIWLIAASPDRTYNLLELVNGVMADLGVSDLDVGRYTQMRLVLGAMPDIGLNILGESHPYACYLIDRDDEIRELAVPGGLETGLKLVDGFEIRAETTTELVLDFNALESVVRAGDGAWRLKPTIHVTDTVDLITITGRVTDSLTGEIIPNALVTAQLSTDDENFDGLNPSTLTDENGNYTLMIPSGEYLIVTTAGGYMPSFTALTVESGMDSTADFALDPVEGVGTLSGVVQINGAEEDDFVSLTLWLTVVTDEGEIPFNIATENVADGGEYTIELPAGTYQLIVLISDAEVLVIGDIVIDPEATIVQDIIVDAPVDEGGDDGESEGDVDEAQKITICHKGHDISISMSALPAHIAHGDPQVACAEVDDEDDGEVVDGGEDEGDGDDGDVVDDGDDEDDGDDGDGDDEEKVEVCHNGHTIEISVSALESHLAHGDTEGPCPEE